MGPGSQHSQRRTVGWHSVGAQGTFAAIGEGSGQQLAQSRGSSAAQTPGPLMWLTFGFVFAGHTKGHLHLRWPVAHLKTDISCPF